MSPQLFINARRLKIGFLAFAFFLCGSAFVMGTVCTAVYLIAAKTANQTLLQPAHITFFANDLFVRGLRGVIKGSLLADCACAHDKLPLLGWMAMGNGKRGYFHMYHALHAV